jgi:hypothetical protein
MEIELHPNLPRLYESRPIQTEQPKRRAPNHGPREDARRITAPSEMSFPAINSRIE